MIRSGRDQPRGAAATLFVVAMIFLSVAAAESQAEPVYLNCVLVKPKGDIGFKVKLDEHSGRVTHTKADGSAFNTEGFFSAAEVSYKHVDSPGGPDLTYTQQWTISRVDMSVDYQSQLRVTGKYSSIETEESRKPMLLHGRCDIERTPNRHF